MVPVPTFLITQTLQIIILVTYWLITQVNLIYQIAQTLPIMSLFLQNIGLESYAPLMETYRISKTLKMHKTYLLAFHKRKTLDKMTASFLKLEKTIKCLDMDKFH